MRPGKLPTQKRNFAYLGQHDFTRAARLSGNSAMAHPDKKTDFFSAPCARGSESAPISSIACRAATATKRFQYST